MAQIYPFLSEHMNYMLFHTGLSSAAVRIPPALDFFPATQTPSTQRPGLVTLSKANDREQSR